MLFDLIPYDDVLALAFFLTGWAAYSYLADHVGKDHNNLLTITNRYRLQWMREMLRRENRTMDSIMVGNLLRSISFFANTSIFILIGLISMLSYQEKVNTVLSSIPFIRQSQGFVWEMKIFLLIVIFIYAFFKYTWSLRQYNYAGIFVASAPPCRDRVDEHETIAHVGAAMISSAARHFNNGLRAYYFGLAALAWFIHPLAFIGATACVIFVTQRREYRSRTLRALLSSTLPKP